MGKDPAILFYSSDFLSGVTDLTMEERGQYITLLCLQHQKGNLSEKTIRLSVGSVSVDVMSKFLRDENGNYYNLRLKNEIEKRMKFVESRINNGKLGGRPKEKKITDRLFVGYPKNNLPENENENKNKDRNRGVNQKKNILSETKKFSPPSKEEVITFFTSHNYTTGQAEKAYNYYAVANWHDSKGNPVKNWKQKMLANWMKDPPGTKSEAVLQAKKFKEL